MLKKHVVFQSPLKIIIFKGLISRKMLPVAARYFRLASVQVGNQYLNYIEIYMDPDLDQARIIVL